MTDHAFIRLFPPGRAPVSSNAYADSRSSGGRSRKRQGERYWEVTTTWSERYLVKTAIGGHRQGLATGGNEHFVIVSTRHIFNWLSGRLMMRWRGGWYAPKS